MLAARPRRPMAGVRRQFPYLVPLLAWMAVIAVLSTDIGSSSRTTDPVIRIVHRLLNERLEDFGEFARHIDRHLRSQQGN